MANNVKTQNTNLIFIISYFVLFIVNSIIILLANAFFPSYVVLGTFSISLLWALIHSMGTLSLIGLFGIPFARWYEKSRGKMMTSKEWMIYYFFLNLAGIWIVTRFADQLGFGISSIIVAIVLAIIMDILQGLAMMQLEKYRPKLA